MDHAEPQPSPLANLFGGEERFEYARQHLGRHAGAGIPNRQGDIVANGQFMIQKREDPIDRAVLGFEREGTASGHGVASVEHQVENRSLELPGIDHDRPEIVGQAALYGNGLGQGLTEHFDKLRDGRAQRNGTRRERLPAAKREQPLGQLAAAHRRLACRGGELVAGLTRLDAGQQKIEVAQHDLEQIVELVCNAARKLADCLHPFATPARLFEPFALGDLRAQIRCALGDGGFKLADKFGTNPLGAGDLTVEPAGKRDGDQDEQDQSTRQRAARHKVSLAHRVDVGFDVEHEDHVAHRGPRSVPERQHAHRRVRRVAVRSRRGPAAERAAILHGRLGKPGR